MMRMVLALPNQPYITHVAKPKLEKLHAAFPEMLKT